MLTHHRARKLLATGFSLGLVAAFVLLFPAGQEETRSVIVQGRDLASVKAAVQAVGGEVTHELGIISAVSAELSPSEVEALRLRNADLRIYQDHPVGVSGRPSANDVDETIAFSVVVEADRLHDEGLVGSGVAVAVLDTRAHRCPGGQRVEQGA